eukprot:CAMPEP_0167808014 /NCGR_PEP_ID=MMETSP0111_2-20121227/22917_1 /TAXON_ID=91324 /ORGANISM="Lotharella globosa, Strain CCCM811" /LENGTH=204 /DNA_ID=CAMNT_0007706069 /DNA_START=154 /DNA_END=768 /DNA_ORIENTATION=+
MANAFRKKMERLEKKKQRLAEMGIIWEPNKTYEVQMSGEEESEDLDEIDFDARAAAAMKGPEDLEAGKPKEPDYFVEDRVISVSDEDESSEVEDDDDDEEQEGVVEDDGKIEGEDDAADGSMIPPPPQDEVDSDEDRVDEEREKQRERQTQAEVPKKKKKKGGNTVSGRNWLTHVTKFRKGTTSRTKRGKRAEKFTSHVAWVTL